MEDGGTANQRKTQCNGRVNAITETQLTGIGLLIFIKELNSYDKYF